MRQATALPLLAGISMALGAISLPAQHTRRCQTAAKLSSHRSGTPRRVVPILDHIEPSTFSYEIPHPASGHYPESVPLVLTGRHFQRGAFVQFDGKRIKTQYHSATRMEAEVPFAAIQKVKLRGAQTLHGTAQITVTNVTPRRAVSARKKFPIEATAID